MAAGHEKRLRALERRAPAARADSMTLAEWVQWHATGEQPERWLSSPAVQAQIAAMQARSDAVERMMREFEL
jgi:hypothetical protein